MFSVQMFLTLFILKGRSELFGLSSEDILNLSTFCFHVLHFFNIWLTLYTKSFCFDYVFVHTRKQLECSYDGLSSRELI